MSKINEDLRRYRIHELTLRATIVGVTGYVCALGGMLEESAALVLVGIVLMGWAVLNGVKSGTR